MANTPVTVDIQILKSLIKESVREVLKEEWFGLWQSFIPEVSDAEQAEIDQMSGCPSDYDADDFIDMTGWLADEG
ncbi:hypothetical protein [cf. Phormidesmis sp. LEGE 11477]|uniref:hypothetical protein n=1 Tax=cf. Phormidesmis sp. LEGE 11477 TaxID=1828680 RepID=UPI001881625C|nr:hypothetical protein [cf. Phormidesmis sp. LEGE 11477]MBE9061820.1 hypothetical protein [cf. Phormidesmis sp. LEGE 11477]